MSAREPTMGSGLPHPAEVGERVLAAAGGPCVAVVEDTHEADVRFANNTVTTDGVRLVRRVTAVRLSDDAGAPRAGVATASGAVDPATIVARAAAAAVVADDAFALVEGGADPSYGDDAATTSLSRLDGVIEELGPAFLRAARDGRVLSGFVDHRVVTTYLASSTGLRRRHVQPTGSLQLVGRHDGRSSWAATGTADFEGEGVEPLEAEVVRGLGWGRRPMDVPPGRHDVILSPSAVADLMMFLVDAASGRESEEGRTVFSRPHGGTKLGERLTPLPFDLWSDPAAPGLECAPFFVTPASGADVSVFDNGLPLARTDWLRAGHLERLTYHRAGAARSAAVPTPPVDNLALALPGAEGSLGDLVARTERGLLVTCLWYIREVDPKTLLLTGLTRDGVYVVEDGRVVGAAGNFRFNESPIDVLARVTAAGATVRTLGREGAGWCNRTAMPPLQVAGFNMSTASQAV